MIKIGLIGAGNIANIIAANAQAEVVCVFDMFKEKADVFAKKHGCSVKDISRFPKLDLVIEAASQQAVREYGKKVLEGGNDLMVMSTGAFSDDKLFKELKAAAETRGLKVYMPSGAIVGLDGIKAASIGGIDDVVITSTKNPKSLEQTEYLTKKGIKLDGIKKPTVIYEGSARNAVGLFPKNVNVFATVSLVGIGMDRTKVRLIADPKMKTNMHQVKVKGAFGELEATARNVPSPDNPKTSYLAALSAISLINSLDGNISIG